MTHDIIRHGSRDIASVARLDSVAEWIAAARAPASGHWRSKRTQPYSRADYTDSWYGHASFADACRMAEIGWREGRERIAQGLATIKAACPTERPQIGYDVAGAFPDVARAVAGDPMCMVGTAAPELTRRTITVRLWIGILSDVDADAVMAWGAAAASYVDALETAGYAVDLYAVAVARATGANFTRWHAVRVNLKAPDQPLDLDRLAFAAAHAAAHRRLNFGVRESAPEMRAKIGGTVQPAECPAFMRDALDVDGPAIDIPSAGVCGSADPVIAAGYMARYFAHLTEEER